MQAIILSGGKGTRLRPLTDNTPKPMLEIGGKPHLEHIINLLKKHGITDIIFSTGYLHEKISDYFGDGSEFGVKIQYREDGDKPLGTGGAIKNCEDLITSDNFIVFNGDILTDMDIGQFATFHDSLLNSAPKASIALTPVDDPSSYGVAVMNLVRIKRFIEKPTTLDYGNLINSGIYMFDKSVMNEIPKNTYHMVETDLFPQLAEIGQLYGYKDRFMYWLDIGTHERFTQANEDIKKIKI